MRLLRVRLHRARKRRRMRPRQHGQRRDPLGPAVGDDPGQAAAPIMADEMKPAVAVTHGLNDVERVANQLVDPVVVELGRVGPRADRIAPLVRRHSVAASRREGRDLIVPEMP